MDHSTSFFEEFMPHGMCYLWRTDILLLHLISDALIAISYFAIPIALFYFFKERKDFPFRGVILMFSIFIFTCGLTHVMGIWTVWNGTYGLQGLIKSATAAASIATALMLFPVMPQLLALRSPKELEEANLALTHEISERQKSEKQTLRFMEAAPDATLIVNAEGVIKVVNAQAERLFGYAKDKMIGEPVNLLMPKQSRAAHPGLIRKFFSEPSARLMETGRELTGLKNSGESFPIEVSLSAVGTEDEPLVSASIRDITARHEMEEQTQRLEREVAHAGRLNTMGQMATGLAHELNQPLTAITQYADAALSIASRQPDVSPGLLETLNELDKQAYRAGEIIQALRQFVTKDDTARSTFPLADLVNQAIRLVEADAKANDVRIQTEIGAVPPVVGAHVQIAQVLVNLLQNAIEAIMAVAADTRRIVISAHEESDAIQVAVWDTGPGLDADWDVFMPFQTTKSDGMGMGLSICRSIIEAHGGRFWVDRNVDAGARFCFTLPTAADKSDD
ncbi:MAG: ATP-binding protein [Pseudomonadota bacterium]